MANLFVVGVLVGPGPFRFVAFLFFGDETQVWLGDLRVVLFLMVFVLCYDLPNGIGQLRLIPIFHCLYRYQDRATEHLRPNSRKKKKRFRHSCLYLCQHWY